MTGKLTEEDIEKLFKYLADHILEHPEKANEIMEFAQIVKPLIQNQMTTADIYNEIAVENLELKEIKNRLEEWKKRLQSNAHLIEYSHQMLIDKIDNELLKSN